MALDRAVRYALDVEKNIAPGGQLGPDALESGEGIQLAALWANIAKASYRFGSIRNPDYVQDETPAPPS